MRTWTLVLGVLAASCSTDTFSSDAGDDASDASDDRPGDSSAAPFCATVTPVPFFCMDFDEGDPQVAFQSGSAIKVPAPSPATSTMFALGADGIGGSGDALFTTSGITTGTHTDWYFQPLTCDTSAVGVSLKFAWRLDTYKQATNPTSASSGEIAHLNVHDKTQTGATLLAIFFLTGEGHAGMTFNGVDGAQFQSFSLPTLGTWHQVELKITLMTAAAARFDVIFDGNGVGNLQNHGAFPAPQSDFNLGASVTGPFQATGWSIDNAIFGPLL